MELISEGNHHINMKSTILLFLLIAMSLSFETAGVMASECRPTQADVEGPFYLADTPFRELIAAPDEWGQRIIISGKVLSGDCKTALEGVIVEVWHTDIKGKYKGKDEGELFRGRVKSGHDGSYRFSTIMPGRYRLGKSYRPAHIHFRVSSPGYKTLVTQLYFSGDPYLAPNDPCGRACRSGDTARIVELRKETSLYTGYFPIILKRVRK